MLPFLKPKRDSGLIISHRHSNGSAEEQNTGEPQEEDEQDSALMACAQDLRNAVKLDDVPGIARAMRAAFQILESEPHEEEAGEPTNDYDSLNALAAKGQD